MGVDLFIVTVYAYALFVIQIFQGHPRASIARYLFAFPAFFLLYWWSGWLRRRAHGPTASRPRAIKEFGLVYLLLWVLYVALADGTWGKVSVTLREPLNVVFLLLFGTLMIAYRQHRARLRRPLLARKERGGRIGVDVDGVLANQIDGVIPRIKERYGIAITYDEIATWNQPIGTRTDIKTEIEDAMSDPVYILGMSSHVGAQAFMQQLWPDNTIVVVTARPREARELTKKVA